MNEHIKILFKILLSIIINTLLWFLALGVHGAYNGYYDSPTYLSYFLGFFFGFWNGLILGIIPPKFTLKPYKVLIFGSLFAFVISAFWITSLVTANKFLGKPPDETGVSIIHLISYFGSISFVPNILTLLILNALFARKVTPAS